MCQARARRVDPRAVGLAAAPLSALAGGTAEENAALIERVLGGERGPIRAVVLLNAGAALLVAGRAHRLGDGVALAASVIDDGRALARLARLRASTALSEEVSDAA